MRGARINCCLVLMVGAWSMPAAAVTSGNLLRDPSFEERVNEPFSEFWQPFGHAFCEFTTPRTGGYAVKLHGAFKRTQNWSGVFQDVPCQPGHSYFASGYLRQNTGDMLKGGSQAWVRMEFYDAQWKQLYVSQSPKRLQEKSEANEFVYFSTGRAEAPLDAVTVRIVAIFEQQDDDAPGAAIVDDLSLREVP